METDKSIVKGDVFCIEIDKSYKCFFQYIGNDKTNWNRSVIKVFNTRYPLDEPLDLKEIVNQKTCFWACTFIEKGIRSEVWYKVGNIENAITFDNEDYNFISYTRPKENNNQNLTAPEEHGCWWIWRINEEVSQTFPVPYDIIDKLEDAKSRRPEEIIERIKLGYYKSGSPVYDVIKRKPLPGVQSYLKTQSVSEIRFYNFDGENLIRQISISKIDGSVKTNEFEIEGNLKFWDRNWEYYEFISPQQFKSTWNKYASKNPIKVLTRITSGLFKKTPLSKS